MFFCFSRCTGIEHPCFCSMEYVACDWLGEGNSTVTEPAGFVKPEYKSSRVKVTFFCLLPPWICPSYHLFNAFTQRTN